MTLGENFVEHVLPAATDIINHEEHNLVGDAQQTNRRAQAISIAQRVIREESDTEDPFVILSQEFLSAVGVRVPVLGSHHVP